jgi:hydrogenase-4 transcriptional activator
MPRLERSLLEAWREASRHLAISENARQLAPLVARHVPSAGLILRRADAGSRSLETVATVGCEEIQIPARDRTFWSTAQWTRADAWSKSKGFLLSAGRRSAEANLLLPPWVVGAVAVCALRQESEFSGVAIVLAQKEQPFHPLQEEILRAFSEPLAAAMENDRRHHELVSLREAAEADRRSLLSRMGRDDKQETIVGTGSGLRHVMERVHLVAQSDLPVLILGETGTGKEVVSRAIHSRSMRKEKPFIRVNCGAIPPELMDSQLFGHEKGSFTGASEARKGWFERADGGTLFLDEIGELPLQAQVRLLRVLQDGLIDRVGSESSNRVDVRIVAATHRDLASMVKGGAFREDLWYRINVFPILLPRLSERPEDIPALARHFAERAARRFGLPHVEPSPADLQRLMRYHWPGNIRELGAVIDRAAILGDGRTLDVQTALGPMDLNALPSQPASVQSDHETPRSLVIIRLDQHIKQHIEHALLATRGKIEGKRGAAELLGVNPHTLRSRMRKLNIPWGTYR